MKTNKIAAKITSKRRKEVANLVKKANTEIEFHRIISRTRGFRIW